MVRRTQQDNAPDLNRLNAHGTSPTSHSPSFERSQSRENLLNDELIVSLSDAHENKRARQVNEWERRQKVAAAF
ncbi:MAG TPA: hypothetical protein VGJ02_09390 [Pyrinomonadaceae bacterium]